MNNTDFQTDNSIWEYMHIAALMLMLSFPVLVNHIKHTGSIMLILLSLIGFPICMSRARRPKVSNEARQLMWAFGIYVLVFLVSFIVNSLSGNLENPRMRYIDHELRLLFFIPVMYLLQYIRLPQWVFWYGLSAGAVVSGIYAVFFRLMIQEAERVSGSAHAIAFGNLSLVMAFMSFAGFRYFRERHTALVIIPIAGLVLGMVASFLSGTRGAWIAIPALLFVVFRQFGGYFRLWLRGLIIGLVCLVCLAAYAIPKAETDNRINAVFYETKAYQEGKVIGGAGLRYEMWKGAWDIYRKNPILGIGPGGYKSSVLKMISEGKLDEEIAIFSRPHSAYLTAMTSCGSIGLLALLGIFFVPLKGAICGIYQKGPGREIGYAGLMLIVGYMHFSLTSGIFTRNLLSSFYVILLAAVFSLLARHRGSQGKSK